jgi:anti-anti-sigma factor
MMQIHEEKLEKGAYKITLAGRMDILGVGQIETLFAGMCASPRMSIIVDLSQVDFLSSIGIRAIITNAKSVSLRSGNFVLFGMQPPVQHVLQVSGLDKALSISETFEDALAVIASFD